MKKRIKGVFFSVILLGILLAGSVLPMVVKASVGDTIAETFPDGNLSQVVADTLSSGDVNATLTQSMVDNCIQLDGTSKNIVDLTGLDVMTGLEVLKLSDNAIVTLPANLGDLVNLKEIYINNNLITGLPNTLGDLSNLKILDITSNKITSLPSNFGDLSNLEQFLGDNNKIIDLPSNFGDLKKLLVLKLDNNQLTTLPSSFGDLISLNSLHLANNQLISLSSNFGDLQALENLYLDHNYLTLLPATFGDLINLKGVISLDSNQLINLPENIIDILNAQNIYLGDNLLPGNYSTVLINQGMNGIVPNEVQNQLNVMPGTLPFTITKGQDISNLDYPSFIFLVNSPNKELSSNHQFVLHNYRDENTNPINIEDYIKNGIVQKSGKVFAQIRSTGTGLYPDTGIPADTIDFIELNFQPIYYNLSFDLNGSFGVIPSTQSLIEGFLGTSVNDPTRIGYSFKGWNTASNGSGTSWLPGTTPMVGQNTTLFAQWEPNQYKIHFDANSGTGSMDDQTFNFDETKGLSPDAFIKTGYTFKGWSITPGGDITYVDQGDYTYTTPDNITLYAVWEANKYKVTFSANGGTGTMVDENYTYDETKVLDKGLYTRIGYTFLGWSTTSNGNVAYLDEGNYTYQTEGDVTLYAQWQPNPYKIIFDGNSGLGTMNNQNYNFDETKNLDKDTFTKKGYTFKGWSTTPTGAIEYMDEESYTFTTPNDVTLYAKWQANPYKVIFNANGGTGTMVDENYTYDETKKLDKDTYTRVGYTFLGWSTTPDGNVIYLDEADFTYGNEGDVTLYAKWKPNTYKIIFDGNGGTGSMVDEVFTYDETKNLDKNLFTRNGYTFKGWSTSPTGAISYLDSTSYTYTIDGDVTLYAQWTENATPIPPTDNTLDGKNQSSGYKLPSTGNQTILILGFLFSFSGGLVFLGRRYLFIRR